MILSDQQIQSALCGAESMERRADGLFFYRMTQQQLDVYREPNPAFYKKALANAGICLSFATDSSFIRLDASLAIVMGRSYGTLEVLADDKPVGNINNYDHLTLPRDYAEMSYPEVRKNVVFDLGEGTKHVKILFPRLMGVVLHSLELADGAAFAPVKPEKKLLAFGDSITQGFDCLRPSSHYVYQLCNALGAEEYNKGVGGERHVPTLARCDESFAPDYILVAYGTNDWAHETPDLLQEKCSAFYQVLAEKYPDVPVITVTPIWRSNIEKLASNVAFESFHQVEACIREITADYQNVTLIRGYDLVPHDLMAFGDYGLHPSDQGFVHYGKNLLAALCDCDFLKKD